MTNTKPKLINKDKYELPPVKPIDADLFAPTKPEKPKDPAMQTYKDSYVKSGLYLQASVHWQDNEYVPSVRNELIYEFKASSISELMIIDTVVNAYFSYMRSSKALKSFIEDNDGRREYESQTWINMLKELVKVVDMANRHFSTTLTLLKEYKQPPIKVRVQTNAAYISQNQQFNKNA